MLQSKKIIRLAEEISNKIAAGEVVDRPVSIVKELVENSIDARADSIIVEIKEGGKTYIRVSDNGSGIDKEYIELAFERHATSKIETSEDIDNIRSLGFRGEALASIAAVSHTEIITKTYDNDTGIRMRIAGGKIQDKSEIGCPEGTTILIKDLFYNVPARLKFLKQSATEANLVIDLLSKLSLAYPNIKFRLINNSKILFTTNGAGDMQKNRRSIYKNDSGQDLLEVIGEKELYKLKGYISKPSTSKSNRKYQIIFVNGRYIHNSIIDKSISRAYKELLFDNRYPIAFLFLEVDPLWVDVNIHPNKKEVKFRDEKTVEEFLYNTLRSGLKTGDIIPNMLKEELFKVQETSIFKNNSQNFYHESKKDKQVDIKEILETKSDYENKYKEYYKDNLAREDVIEKTEKIIGKPLQTESSASRRGETSLEIPIKKKKGFNMLSFKIMGTIFGTYILASDEDYLYLIDQHAAHERVLYERFLNEYRSEKVVIQSLLVSEIINLSLSNSYKTEKNLDFINRVGFDMASFGKNSFVIKGIPYGLEFKEAKNFLYEIIENLDEDFSSDNPMKIERIIGNACKKAVKANDYLDEKEVDALILSLSQTDNPFSCPHGRPVFIKLSQGELERKFKR